ncbi:hypothetical protein JTB14_019431 [Gonioctena quinquepunctata]|nr:hypothetical protein JTB14_019431 [Gonioctena quinquepunctata]
METEVLHEKKPPDKEAASNSIIQTDNDSRHPVVGDDTPSAQESKSEQDYRVPHFHVGPGPVLMRKSEIHEDNREGAMAQPPPSPPTPEWQDAETGKGNTPQKINIYKKNVNIYLPENTKEAIYAHDSGGSVTSIVGNTEDDSLVINIQAQGEPTKVSETENVAPRVVNAQVEVIDRYQKKEMGTAGACTEALNNSREILEIMVDDAMNETVIEMPTKYLDAFRNRIQSDASKTENETYDTSDCKESAAEFVKPKNRAKLAEKEDDDKSDSSINQNKRKRVESPTRDSPGDTKPCDCGGDSINHKRFYESKGDPPKKHACIGSKADTQKQVGCELYTKNEYNKRKEELNTFESEYIGEADPEQSENRITRCECGEDATITHFLYNKERPECKTRCLGSIELTESHYTFPLITKQQRDEQLMDNKKSEMTTDYVPDLGKEPAIVSEEMDATTEKPSMSEADRKVLENPSKMEKEREQRIALKQERTKEQGQKERRAEKPKTKPNPIDISVKDLKGAGPSRKQVYNYQKPDSRQSTGDTEDTDNSDTSGRANPKRKKTSTLEGTKPPKEKQLQKQYKDNTSRLRDIEEEIRKKASKKTEANIKIINQAFADIPAGEDLPLQPIQAGTWETAYKHWIGVYTEQRRAEIEECKGKVKKHSYLNEKAKRDLATPRGGTYEDNYPPLGEPQGFTHPKNTRKLKLMDKRDSVMETMETSNRYQVLDNEEVITTEEMEKTTEVRKLLPQNRAKKQMKQNMPPIIIAGIFAIDQATSKRWEKELKLEDTLMWKFNAGTTVLYTFTVRTSPGTKVAGLEYEERPRTRAAEGYASTSSGAQR